MATSIYLGMPPANVVKWIKENVKTGPIFKDETQVVYVDGTTWEGLIEGELTDKSIPNTYQIKELIIGNKVTKIVDSAFVSIHSMTALYIPNSVTVIDNQAFYYCISLKEITIPDSVTSIGQDAFADCHALITLNLPDNTITINKNAFQFSPISSIPNRTTQQIKQWFDNDVFGHGDGQDWTSPGSLTITCKDGIIHASGIFNYDEQYGEGWDITITPL